MRILMWRFGWIGLLLTLTLSAWAQQVATGVVLTGQASYVFRGEVYV